jgi:hypothetical protein
MQPELPVQPQPPSLAALKRRGSSQLPSPELWAASPRRCQAAAPPQQLDVSHPLVPWPQRRLPVALKQWPELAERCSGPSAAEERSCVAQAEPAVPQQPAQAERPSQPEEPRP